MAALRDIQQLATTLMREHGLRRRGWSFAFDNAKVRFGCCKYRSRVISLSRALVRANSLEAARDTLLHEIAHALVGRGHHHDAVWKQAAQAIGCTGERCYDSGLINTPTPAWVGQCAAPGCQGHERHRRMRRAYCTRCAKKNGIRLSRKTPVDTLTHYQIHWIRREDSE